MRAPGIKGSRLVSRLSGGFDSVLPPGQDLHWDLNGPGGGSDVLRHAAQRPGKLGFAVPGQAVIYHLLSQVRRQWPLSQHVLERVADGGTTVESMRECLRRLSIDGGARWGRSDQRECCEAFRPS